MISKDQFLELKHLKSLGVPTTTIAKKIGISVPNANKWLRLEVVSRVMRKFICRLRLNEVNRQ